MRRCNRCVLSERFPGIKFDDAGVCNNCLHHEAVSDPDWSGIKENISRYLDSIRGKGRYDAIVCYSGGKDSTYALMLAVKRYGLRVLAFTFDNGFLSEKADANINRVVESLGVDLIRFKADQKTFNAMVKLSAIADVYPLRSLTRVSSICQTCVNLINLKALEFAISFRVPTIIAGFTLGQIPKSAVMYEFKYAAIQEFRTEQNQRFIEALGPDVVPYLQLEEDISKLDSYPMYLNLLAAERIDEADILAECKRFGWVMPSDTDGCSSNCRLNSVGNMLSLSKLGFHPYEAELSSLIRNGLLTREEAITKLGDFGCKENIIRNVERLGISSEELAIVLEGSEWTDLCAK